MLQGSFDIFSLTELVAMLASGTKTGTLEVQAGAVGGRIHFREGLCCGVEPSAAATTDDDVASALVDLGFELLCQPEGEFRFVTEEPPESDHLVAIDEPVTAMLARLDEWHEVQDLVPSLELCPRLAPELGAAEITLTAAEWAFAVQLDGRASVRALADARGDSLLALCQEIAALVERGALRLAEPADRALGDPVAFDAPAVVPVEPYGPGVDPAGPGVDPAGPADEPVASGEADSEPVGEVAADDHVEDAVEAGVETEGLPLDGDDVKDRGALLRMFSALRDA